MKKGITLIITIVFMLLVFITVPSAFAAESDDSYSADDWKPFNHVLMEGFGLNAKRVNIRTFVDYDNDELKVYGNTSKGGVGVTFLPEIELDGFSIEMSLDSWQVNSTDKWFGFTLMDKAEKSDIYNEVPFYSKHSESWSNDMGAGTLVAWRPFPQTGTNARPGVIQIQFNNIGIEHSFVDPQVGDYNENAGQYADGVLGWSGYLSTIQLCDTNWEPLTDYSYIKVSIREITVDGRKGYAFDFNDGYYIRTEDSIVWPTKESDPNLFAEIDKNGNDVFDDWEMRLFSYGPAYSYEYEGTTYQSMVPYANWGDPLYSLYNFNELVQKDGGRLYLSVMYKDAFNMPEGENAQFTIKKLNGKKVTKSETTSLFEDKTVDANGFSATISYTKFYAGVYPYMVDGIHYKDADQNSYKNVIAKIDTKRGELSANTSKAVNFYGKVGNKDVAIIDNLQVTYNLEGKSNFKIYKITGTDLDEVSTQIQDGKATFNVRTHDSNGKLVTYVIFYSEQGGGQGCGCSGDINPILVVLPFAALALSLLALKKRAN